MTATQTLGPPGKVKEITSLANPVVKSIRALSQKKQRERQNMFLAEGLKLIVDALDQGWHVKTLVLATSGRENTAAQNAAARVIAAGGDVIVVPEKVLGAITRRDNPQLVVGVFERRQLRLDTIKPAGSDVWVALNRVRDPGNLGTIIRTVDAVGAKGVILLGDCTDPFSQEAVRATMGSVFAVPIASTSEGVFLDWCANSGALVAGTHLAGAMDYRQPGYDKKPVVLVMGNEQQGLSDSLAGKCDVLVRIPQAGRADSLNLSVSTGIMLYEIRRTALGIDAGGTG